MNTYIIIFIFIIIIFEPLENTKGV